MHPRFPLDHRFRHFILLETLWFTVGLGLITQPTLAADQNNDRTRDQVTETSPNIVYIISDDQTWTDFGFMGNRRVATPHLDALAARSARFVNGYVPSSVCRPSLATLLTGLYPHQHGLHFNHGPPGNAGYNRMTSRQQYQQTRSREFTLIRQLDTLPGLLGRERGYRSLQTGKFWEGPWENGQFTEGMTRFEAPPEDQTFGGLRVLASGDRVAHGNGDIGLSIGRQTMKPIDDFIRDSEADKQPWLVWYAPYLPHQPHDSPEPFYQMAAARPDVAQHELPYFAAIAQFDETVGHLVRLVRDAEAMSRTLFVFVVDNGWSPSTTPQRGRPEEFAPTATSKWAPFDEGLRTPILLSWEGMIQPATYTTPVGTVDLLPTLLSAAGVPIAKRPPLPGQDLMPVARGQQALEPQRPVFGELYPNDATELGRPELDIGYRWVRRGDYKLIVPTAAAGRKPWRAYLDGPALFDLAKDPHETENLIQREDLADTVADLRRLLDHWWDGVENRVIASP
ncbi:MAG: sulfatase [Planctomycetaceae bacterium]|nr:MAG: sulfatase [Planctomycetaceae bacterium]